MRYFYFLFCQNKKLIKIFFKKKERKKTDNNNKQNTKPNQKNSVWHPFATIINKFMCYYVMLYVYEKCKAVKA